DFDLRTLRETAISAGTVVAAPMAISIAPTARRRWAGIRSDRSRPMPTPSAARVLTMKPKVGRLRRTLFINTLLNRVEKLQVLAVDRCCPACPAATKAAIEGFRAPRRVEYRIHASTAPPMPNM